jgi:hypothetical protein
MNYITATGITEKLEVPVNWHGFRADAFAAKSCNLVNIITRNRWGSNDLNARLAAEVTAAAEYADQNNFLGSSQVLLNRAKILLDILDPKPRWRELH